MTDGIVDDYFSSALARDSAPTERMPGQSIVDHQFHWYPLPYLESLRDRSDYPRVEVTAGGEYTLLVGPDIAQPTVSTLSLDIKEHLAHAEAAGIHQVVVGPATLGEVLHLHPREAADMLEIIHTSYADAQRRHPGRIVALAALPMQDADTALAVADHAIGELGLRGVSLLTVNEGRPLISDELMPVFERIAEYNVPIVLHPGGRAPTRAHTRGFRQEVGLGWMYQTAAGALELIDSGLLDRAPQLQIVHPHLGGVLPYVAGRISPIPGSLAKEPIEHYLRTNFYADTAGATPAAIHTAIQTYGIDRIVFATDHPFIPMGSMRSFLEDNVTGAEAEQVYRNRVPGLHAEPAGTSGVASR